jgi:four helix bundle protein
MAGNNHKSKGIAGRNTKRDASCVLSIAFSKHGKKYKYIIREYNMERKIRTYRDLDIWNKGIEIVKDAYKSTEKLPKQEIYGLISQMRRAAVSIPSNIAEGFRRYHNKEYKQFLYVSLGSCAELETQITITKELGYLTANEEEILLEKLDHLCRMITNLIKKL